MELIDIASASLYIEGVQRLTRLSALPASFPAVLIKRASRSYDVVLCDKLILPDSLPLKYCAARAACCR